MRGATAAKLRERLLPFVCEELRMLARSHLRRERPGHTVQTGTLVHNAFIRLIEGKQVRWEGRAHFFGIAARLMRQILVDHARARGAVKRGTGDAIEPVASALSVAVHAMDVDVIALDRALEELSAVDPARTRSALTSVSRGSLRAAQYAHRGNRVAAEGPARGFPCYPWYERDRLLAPLRQNASFQRFLQDFKQSWETMKAQYETER